MPNFAFSPELIEVLPVLMKIQAHFRAVSWYEDQALPFRLSLKQHFVRFGLAGARLYLLFGEFVHRLTHEAQPSGGLRIYFKLSLASQL